MNPRSQVGDYFVTRAVSWRTRPNAHTHKGRPPRRQSAHQRLIMANLATQLFEHGRIVTTEAKAKRLRPLAEKLITKAKRGDIHSRRLVLTTVRDKGVVHTLFTEIAPSLADREGGYTRITKVGPRKGDDAHGIDRVGSGIGRGQPEG